MVKVKLVNMPYITAEKKLETNFHIFSIYTYMVTWLQKSQKYARNKLSTVDIDFLGVYIPNIVFSKRLIDYLFTFVYN